ncbi:hypothetical protein TIFTF001_037180 [Ficus carica]|uniref:Uncharacterized protein n=1 Tax=Ficus carica TaxID=3494 RepID=A0AA88JBU4_FICCA|nr:hypothetical protein TIFTF001_037180 [Ficus carica]
MRETNLFAALVMVRPDQVVRDPNRVAAVREEHGDVMPAEKSWVLPPRQTDEGGIERGARPLARDPFRMVLLSDRAVWKKQPGELLAAVQPLKFQRKRDGMLQMCAVDRAINQVTVGSTYHVLNVAGKFDWSLKAVFLARLEGKSGCGQVGIANGDKVMRAWVMCSGLERAIGGVQEGHPIVVGMPSLGTGVAKPRRVALVGEVLFKGFADKHDGGKKLGAWED